MWPTFLVFYCANQILRIAYEVTASQYLPELVRRCDDTRLRSNVRGNFVVSRVRLHVINKAFYIDGSRAWNALPSDMKLISSRTSFRKKLKTHFFSLI